MSHLRDGTASWFATCQCIPPGVAREQARPAWAGGAIHSFSLRNCSGSPPTATIGVTDFVLPPGWKLPEGGQDSMPPCSGEQANLPLLLQNCSLLNRRLSSRLLICRTDSERRRPSTRMQSWAGFFSPPRHPREASHHRIARG